MTPHPVDCECLDCANAGLTTTWCKGTVLSCDSKQAMVRKEDGTEAILDRPGSIPVYLWQEIYPVGKEVTWKISKLMGRETAHHVNCECLGCEDARAGLKRTFYKGTVLTVDSATATVQGEDGQEHKFLRPRDIPIYTWTAMFTVGKTNTWSDTRETTH